MIIKGELDDYEVRYVTDSIGYCYVAIYKGPVTRKKFFGLIEIENEPTYTTFAAADHSHYKEYAVKRMLPNAMTAWFTKAVQEYELFTRAWNQ